MTDRLGRRPKLTAAEMAEARHFYFNSKLKISQIARLMKVSPSVITKCVDGTYKPAPDPADKDPA